MRLTVELTLEKRGVGVISPHVVENLITTFDSPQNLITNSLLLIGSLTENINSQLTHILYVVCIIYCILTIK